jgi:hypothetical protein
MSANGTAAASGSVELGANLTSFPLSDVVSGEGAPPPSTRHPDTKDATMNMLTVPFAGTIIRACPQCSRSLTGMRPQAVYCSESCSKRFRRGTASDAPETRTSPQPLRGQPGSPVRVSEASGRLSGLLAHLTDEAPGYIESSHTGRVFPRTYAEHGLALPDYLRVA